LPSSAKADYEKGQVTVKKDAFTVYGDFPEAVNFRAESFSIRLKG